MRQSLIHVRRLGRHEIGRFEEAKAFLEGLGRRVRNHSLWTARAMEDLRSGSKIAFGAFVDASDRPDSFFLGSILIERGDPGVVVASNLLVRTPAPGPPDPAWGIADVQRRLVARVESFCRQRGFWQLDVEIFAYDSIPAPSQANLAVNVLLEEGFSLHSIRNSTYFSQDYLYTLTKKLPFAYSGDPHDESEISRWLLEDHFGFVSVGRVRTVYVRDGYCHCYTFEVPFPHDRRTIRGVCVVDIGESADFEEIWRLALGEWQPNLEDQALREGFAYANIRVLITFRKEAPLVNDPRVWSLGIPEIEAILGPEVFGYPNGEDLGGLLIELREDRLEDRLKSQQHFGYYVASGLGTEIFDQFYDPPEKRQDKFYAILASHERGGPVAWGVARLDKIEPCTPATAFASLPASMRLWTPAHFDYYVNDFSSSYKEHERTFVLTMGHPVKFRRPVRLQELPGAPSLGSLADLEVTTRYLDLRVIEHLKQKEPEAFESARDETEDGVPPYQPENVISKLANYLAVLKRHNTRWYPLHQDTEADMLRNDLIVASRALASPRLRDQSVAFRNQSAVRVWVERVERAWVDFEKQKPGCDDGVIAWVVRLASRKLLDAAEPEIGLSPKLIDALKDIFPSAAQLRDRIRKKFHAPIVASLQEEADANARSASRSRMLEERLKLDPDRYSSTVAVVDNKDFAHKLLNELFKKNSYKNLLNLSEYLIEEELDEAGKAELRDMRDALKAMQRIMSN